MVRDPRSAVVALLAVGFAVGACRAGSPSGSDPTDPLATGTGAVATSSPTATLTPDPTLIPDASLPGDLLAIGEPEAFSAAILAGVVPVSTGFVAVGCIKGGDWCGAPAVWTSADGVNWSPQIELPLGPGESARSAKAAIEMGGGLVIGGDVGTASGHIAAAAWRLLPDGGIERASDGPSFVDASIATLLTVGGGLVAIGNGDYYEPAGFRAWHSSDGLAWRPARGPEQTSDVSFPAGVVRLDTGYLAWGPTCAVCVPETSFWHSTDSIEWSQPRRELPGEFAYASAVGVVDAGVVAYGTVGVGPATAAAWALDNGETTWRKTDPPADSDGVQIRHHLRVGHGAILAGTRFAENEAAGLIWLSGPGDSGSRRPIQLPGVEVVGLLQDPSQLDRFIIIGRRPSSDGGVTMLWTGTVEWAP